MAHSTNEVTRSPRRYREQAEGAVNTTFPVYEGFIVSNKDFSKTGRVQVRVPALQTFVAENAQSGERRKEAPTGGDAGKNYIDVRYMSPFIGYSNYDTLREGTEYHQTLKSYGFWGPTPDVGAPVIILFIQGNINNGIIIGSPAGSHNHAIPGIGIGVENSGQGLAALAEKNPKNGAGSGHPIHRLHDILVNQGLASDGVRGQSTSSARRETPSRVFGMLTPGQHQLVMDDGALENNGETTEDANRYTGFAGSQGVADSAYSIDSLVRLRTANGGQILIHDNKGLVYLINPKGTAWVEMTDMGKIELYGLDDISVHSSGNLNLVADKKVNIEGASINMRAREADGIKIWAETGPIDINAFLNLNLTTDLNGNLLVAGHYKETATRIDMNGPVAERACEPTINPLGCNKTVTSSIATRVPEREPWGCHEELQPPATVGSPVIVQQQPNPNDAVAAVVNGTRPPDFVRLGGLVDQFAEIAQEKQALLDKLNQINIQDANIETLVTNALMSAITYSPYTGTMEGIPVIGSGTPVEALNGAAQFIAQNPELIPGAGPYIQAAVIAEGVLSGKTNANEIAGAIASGYISGNPNINPIVGSAINKVIGTGGPQKGPLQEALGALGTRIGNFFSPLGRSVDDGLAVSGNTISRTQAHINNFWTTAQRTVDNSLLQVNERARQLLPAGVEFGITPGEAQAVFRTGLTTNRNHVVRQYGRNTQISQNTFNGLIMADYHYGDSRYFLTKDKTTVDVKPLVDAGATGQLADVIQNDPRNATVNGQIHDVIKYGKYVDFDLDKIARNGFARALQLYDTLEEHQKMQFEIQYYLYTGKWPVVLNLKTKNLRFKQVKERERLITPGTNVVSFEKVSVSTFATPTPSIVTSILTNRKTAGTNSFPEGYLFAVAALVSNFDPNKQVTATGAKGLYQFTELQWNAIVSTFDSSGTVWGLVPVGNTVDQRTDINASTIASCLITQANNSALATVLNRQPTQDELYMAHLFGIADAKVIATAGSSVSLDLLALSAGFVANNSTFTKDTNGDTFTAYDFKQNLRNQISNISYEYSQLYGN